MNSLKFVIAKIILAIGSFFYIIGMGLFFIIVLIFYFPIWVLERLDDTYNWALDQVGSYRR